MPYAEAAAQAALTVATSILKNVVAIATTVRQQADQTDAARSDVAARQEQIASTVAKNIPAHVWDGTRLRLANPDGQLGDAVDLEGPTGPAGPPSLILHAAPTDSGSPAVLHLQPIAEGSNIYGLFVVTTP